MNTPLEVCFLGMDPSAALAKAVHDKAVGLERFAHDIVSCRVTIELLHKHRHQGRPFAVRIALATPGHELHVGRVQHEDAYVALHTAFDDMRRQLEDMVRRQRGQQKTHAPARPAAAPDAASTRHAVDGDLP